MRIEKTNLHIRFSKEIQPGVWKTLELGAEAALETGDSLAESTQKLHQMLAPEFKALWGSGLKKIEKKGNT